MAFNTAPTNLLGAGYVGNSTAASLAIANFSNLTSAEANTTTGDSRKILFALLEGVATNYEALVAAGTAPAKLTIHRGYGAVNGLKTSVTYNITFNLDVAGLEVSIES